MTIDCLGVMTYDMQITAWNSNVHGDLIMTDSPLGALSRPTDLFAELPANDPSKFYDWLLWFYALPPRKKNQCATYLCFGSKQAMLDMVQKIVDWEPEK